jgi:hypothetical protein
MKPIWLPHRIKNIPVLLNSWSIAVCKTDFNERLAAAAYGNSSKAKTNRCSFDFSARNSKAPFQLTKGPVDSGTLKKL